MRKDILLYLSGPITAKNGFSIEENVASALNVYWECLRRGWPAFCPHLSGIFPTAWTVLDHQSWIDYDCAVIDRCSHIVVLDRWETSKGAVMEVDYAKAKGIPIVTSADILSRSDGLVW